MVRYHGTDFLQKAIKKKQTFLTRSLLATPSHLDAVESYIHQGCLADDQYRVPWQKVIKDVNFAQELVSFGKNDVFGLRLNLTAANTTEIWYNQNTCSASVNGVDNDIEVVPSSNPSSPEICSGELQQLHTVPCNMFQESFKQERLSLDLSALENHRIDVLSKADNTMSMKELHAPSLPDLLSGLQQYTVNDPLTLSKSGRSKMTHFLMNESIVQSTEVVFLKSSSDAGFFQESFMKQNMENCQDSFEEYLVQELDGSLECRDKTSEIKKLLDQQQEDDSICGNGISSSQFVIGGKMNHLLPERTVADIFPICNKSFLDINEIVLSEVDLFCQKAVLDSPVKETKLQVASTNTLLQEGYILERDSLSPQKPRMVTDSKMKLLERKFWMQEKYCDEIQASRLPEPEVPGYIETAPCPIQAYKKQRKLSCEKELGSIELSLCWELMNRFSRRGLTGLIHVEEPACKEDFKVAVSEVEKVEKFSACDMYDWRDPVISLTRDKQGKVPSKQKNVRAMDQVDVKSKSINNGELSDCWKIGGNLVLDFMILRGITSNPQMESTTHTSHAEVKKRADHVSQQTDSSSKTESSSFEEQVGSQVNGQVRAMVRSRKPPKHHTTTVKITGEFLEIMNLFEDAATCLVAELKDAGEIPDLSDFKTLTPDVTRLLLKQKEKSLKDLNMSFFHDKSYKTILILHMLIGATDLVANCCLESAIQYLTAVEDKYSDFLTGSLDVVRHKLFQYQADFFEQQKFHPKIIAVCREVETWLKKKRLKSDDIDPKILVLVKRDLPSLMKCLKNALDTGNLLTPAVLTHTSCENIIEILDKYNCLIGPLRMITSSFPWAQFSLVVEFEHQEKTLCKDHCERQNIRHMDFKIEVPHQQASCLKDRECFTSQQLTVIGSQNISQNTQLLHILEARYNIILIQRDYSMLQTKTGVHFADLDIDERTGVIIQSLDALTEDKVVEALVTKVAALSLKYETCWCVFYYKQTTCFQLTAQISRNLARIESTAANFISMSKEQSFDCKIAVCQDFEEVAKLLRRISEQCVEHRTKTGEIAPCQECLTQDMKVSEKFLLHLPCLSSYTAQLMLDKIPRKDLLGAFPKHLMSKLPSIPVKVLMTFFKIVNSDFGLQLDVDGSPETGSEQRSPEDDCYVKRVDSADEVLYPANVDQIHKPWLSEELMESTRTSPKQSLEDFSSQGCQDIIEVKITPPHFHWMTADNFSESCGQDGNTCLESLVPNSSASCGQSEQNNAALKPSFPIHRQLWNKGDDSNIINKNKEIYGQREKASPYLKQMCQEFLNAQRNPQKKQFKPKPTADTNIHSQKFDACKPTNIHSQKFDACKPTNIHSQKFDACKPLEGIVQTYKSYHYLVQGTQSVRSDGTDNETLGSTVGMQYDYISGQHKRQKGMKTLYDGFEINTDTPQSGKYFNKSEENKQIPGFSFPDNSGDNHFLIQQPLIMDVSLNSVADEPRKQQRAELSDRQSTTGKEWAGNTQYHLNQQAQSSAFFLNPEQGRLTLRKTPGKSFSESDSKLRYRGNAYTEELKETAKNLIANSQKFSTFSNHSSRFPTKKLNIGLAQPLRRDNRRTEIETRGLSERTLMQQSPWTFGNSPPMDLESDSPTLVPQSALVLPRQLYHLDAGKENQAVFTVRENQTPQKKRKLMYEPVPGLKNGQTKLVFK